MRGNELIGVLPSWKDGELELQNIKLGYHNGIIKINAIKNYYSQTMGVRRGGQEGALDPPGRPK